MPANNKRGRTSKPRIVTLDIETAPLSVYAWGLWDQNTGVNQIKEEWRILSFSWKVLGEKKVHFERAYIHDDGYVDDANVLLHVWDVLDMSDIVVAQNGRDFDLRKINARLVASGFGPYSPVRVIDTKIAAKKLFAFTSNRLEWMGKHIAGMPKDEHRKFPGFELWAECLKDNKAAWREMEKYNKRDVIATEKLYLAMRPWIEGHPNVATYGGEPHSCPKCGSSSLQHRGVATTQTGQFPRYRCNDCGGWSRGRVADRPVRFRRGLLSN